MKDIFDSQLILGLSARHIIVMLGGLCLMLAPFLVWSAYWDAGKEHVIYGIETQREFGASGMVIFLFLGIASVLGGFIASRVSNIKNEKLLLFLGALTGIAGLLALIITTVQAEIAMVSIGTSFMNNTGIGWYAALTGSMLILFATLIPKVRTLPGNER
ncbi:MAG: hypothetical protein ACPL1Y_05180 [Thermoplasmata archaeon]